MQSHTAYPTLFQLSSHPYSTVVVLLFLSSLLPLFRSLSISFFSHSPEKKKTQQYLFILHVFTTLYKRRQTGKLGEGAKTHIAICSEPPGHTTVTHIYPCWLLPSSSFHPPSLLLSLPALRLNPVCGLTVILAVWVTGSLVWYLKGRKTDQRLFT